MLDTSPTPVPPRTAEMAPRNTRARGSRPGDVRVRIPRKGDTSVTRRASILLHRLLGA